MNAPHNPRPRLITADAKTVSGADFFRMVTGRPPITDEERATRQAEADAFWEQRHREYEAETLRIRQRTAEMLEQMKTRRNA